MTLFIVLSYFFSAYNPAYALPYPGGVQPPTVSYHAGQQVVNMPPLT